ncbi:SRPBCC family protein [Saccharothrix violaceirubra]|uniref:Uncharacterized protein YndB with AHSA1/START domain n=1 Tax=Saccharothrix violaceirubra TaxID=413306 RepID=A0A7W7SY90_9PSEU|nr:SRPBCC domain-containing protein [Saccharothrix violaceirubra]MBB4963144.1 uncharacterized protein YndB with AHSA1/START domain [Saccharothrix violaceirubra]
MSTWTTPSPVELALTRSFDAPQELVFAAFTDPARVVNWLLGPEGWTMPVCEIDLRQGGRWHMEWRRADGSELSTDGEYLEVTPCSRTQQTESWGGDWARTVNTTEFVADGASRTTVVRTMWFPSREARDRALGAGMDDGATASYDRLEAYLKTL